MNSKINEDIEKILLDSSEIEKITDTLAKKISKDYQDKNLLLICILKGSVIFTADLMRKLDIPCRIEFMQASSYKDSTTPSAHIEIVKDISCPLDDFDVLIVEDIVDTGNTLSYIKKYLKDKGAKSVEICALLWKKIKEERKISVKYIGVEVSDDFVVGYGLDFAERYRALPYIGVLKPQLYNNKEV